MASIWDTIDGSGHDFTLVSNQTGTSLYYCEQCATLMWVDNQSRVDIWHPPPGSNTLLGKCQPIEVSFTGCRTLQDKIKAMNDRDYERLKQI